MRPGLSLALLTLLGAVVYGVVVGALIASALWWRLG
jgi:hypothetical protein